ncbi:pre-mRNA 3' end processing protein WDR33 isoform X2 [Gadus macrocephalus]|uniref:pre-mRNA 3' end processing protein WDR33 isoform X2 n=1 Tax=Gadus macrocephalus TaxID=80720 RepID=UPI0028CB54CE|nr:pre-mRNA 3' end processing protein WDR33 isoform X2 [Gadus macrocephalus]
MHWDKALPAPGPPRPYQGVRVRDPVRELLRRKRGLEQQDGPGTAPPAVDASPHHNPSPYTPVSCSGFGVQSGAVDRGRGPGGDWAVQHQGAQPFQPPQFLQPAPAWCPVDCGQQHLPSAPGPPSYPGSRGLAGEVYMKTLGPSYALVGPPHTLLTYTHAPLLTGLGMESPDAGLTYFPWGAPPLASISTLPPPAVQLAARSVSWPCSALVHRPLSGPGPGPVPGAFVSATLPKAELFQEPERSAFPQPVREDPSPHRHHPDLEASMERAPGPLDHLVEHAPGPLDHLVEQGPGPLEHLVEHAPGPLDHLVEQGPGPLEHLVEQGPGPLEHLMEQGPGPLEHLMEQGPGPLDHLMEHAPGPLDHLVEQGPGPLDHLVQQGPGPLDHLMEASMEQGPGPLDHLVKQGPGPLDHLVEQAPGPLDNLVEAEVEQAPGPLDNLVEAEVEQAPGPLDHLVEAEGEQGPGPLDHLVEAEVEQGPGPLDHLVEAEVEQGPGPLDHLVEREMEPMNPLERLLEEPDEGGSGRGGPERFRSSLFSVHI